MRAALTMTPPLMGGGAHPPTHSFRKADAGRMNNGAW
jgi:hypothetical protein